MVQKIHRDYDSKLDYRLSKLDAIMWNKVLNSIRISSICFLGKSAYENIDPGHSFTLNLAEIAL
jgi:hypothetical protein